jgi:signal transduction histidine kinase
MKKVQEQEQATHILVVDDEQSHRDTLAELLQRNGYVVTTTSSGEAALKVLEHEHCDLTLLDIHMPEMDGFTVLTFIRAHKRTHDLPVIFLTGHMRDAQDMEHGFELGVNEYLYKPIDAGELLVRVRSILRLTTAEKRLRQLQDDYFSMLVHDLRGPLVGIAGFTEMLLTDTVVKKTRQEILQIMMESCNYMKSIIDDILDLSKLEAEYVKLNTKEIDLLEVVKRAVARLRPLLAKKSLTFVMKPVSSSIRITADAKKLEQVIDNLVGNAIKFTMIGGRITLTTTYIECPQQDLVSRGISDPVVLVSITDTGPGIPAKEIASLFEKYRQTSGNSHITLKGTGLGLAICRSIVEAHGGVIWVESQEGIGSTFSFALPLGKKKEVT